MIFDMYTMLSIYDRPKKTVLNRAMTRAFHMDNPIGDPFGGPAYGDFNSPVVKAVESVGRWIDREVLQPVYKEVIKPVGKALEKIGQGIAKDPLTFIAQAAAVAAAPMTGGASLWALPVISAASTAAKGGSLEQILTATAVSAATAAVGGGFGMENSVGGLIMNGLQTGGSVAAGTATYGIMGTSIASTTAQAIATAGTGVAMAGIGAGAAAVQGKDAWQAAFPTLIGSAIGAGTQMLGGTAAFQSIGKALDEVSKTVGPTVAKALSGVATATLTGALTGKDMTQAAMYSLANTAVSGLVSSTNFVADFFRNDAGGITEMGAATQSVVADLLGSVAATVASGGKMGTVMGAQFLTNTVKTLVPFLDSKFDALATNVQLTYKDAEKKVDALNDAANAQQKTVDAYNAAVKKTNTLADDINDLISDRDDVVEKYNKATTQADIDKYKAEFDKIEKSIAAKRKEYDAVYDTIDDLNADYLKSVKTTEAAQKEYFDVSKSLGTLGTQLSTKMNDMSKALVKSVVQDIDPNFNEADYRKYNNIGSGVDAYTHFLSVGKDKGLPTNADAAMPMIQDQYSRLAKDIIQKQWGIYQPPASMVADLKSKLYMQYGNNLESLRDATADNVTGWSGSISKSIDGYLPAYNSQQAKDAQLKDAINQSLTPGWYQPSGYKMPAGMKYASQQDIAEMMATGAKIYTAIDDKGYTVYLKQDTNYKPIQKYNPTTGNIEPTASVLTDMVTLQNMDATDKVKFLAKMSQQTSDYLEKTSPELIETAKYAKTIYNAITSADTPDFLKTSVTSMLGAAGSVVKQTKFLGDIADFIGVTSVSDKTSDMYRWGAAMEKAANALTPESYKAAMAEANGIIDKAEGVFGTLGAFGKVLGEYGAEVTASVIVKEISEEIFQYPTEKLAAGAAGTLAGALGLAATPVAVIAAGAGISTAIFNSLSESYVGSYETTRDKLVELGMKQGLTKDQALQAAEAPAREAGLYGMLPTAVLEGVLPKTLSKWMFKTPDAVQEGLVNKFYDAAKMIATESGSEAVEGAIQEITNGMVINSIYPGAVDLPKSATVGFAWGAIVGGPTAAGTAGSISGASNLATLVSLGNAQLGSQIVKFQNGDYTMGEFGTKLNQWFPSNDVALQSVKADIMPEIFRTASVDLSAGYSDPTNFMEAIKSNLGIYEVANLADIANSAPKFAGKVTTLEEAKTALKNAGYTNVTDADALNSGIVGTTKPDQANIVKTYTDTHTVTEAEAKKYFADLGYKPNAAEIAQFIGQGANIDQNKIKTNVTTYADQHTVTAAEAKKFLQDLGYTNPTQAEIDQFVFSGQMVDPSKIKTDVGKYVDTHQVTEAEAKKYFADLGYKPTDAEIKSFVKHGANVDPTKVNSDVEAYVDPRQMTYAEAENYLKKVGYKNPTKEEIEKFVGQAQDSFFEVKRSQTLESYAQQHTVNLDDVIRRFAMEGYGGNKPYATPSIDEANKFIQQGADVNRLAVLQNAQEYADKIITTPEEAAQFFKDLGYTPTKEELAAYTGKVVQGDKALDEAAVKNAISSYVDPRYVTIEEVKAAALKEGYTITDKEAAAYVGQFDQAKKLAEVTGYADPLAVLQTEAAQYFKDLNYTPTAAELAAYVGQKKEADVKAAIATYVDPRYADADEVRAAALKEGYTLTEKEVAEFVGQVDEAKRLAEVTGYADPLAVLQTEAAQYFKDLNYVPTAKELADYVGQKKEADIKAAIATYVDPRYTDAAEVKAAALKEGYTLTDKELASFVGQFEEAKKLAEVTGYADAGAVLQSEAAKYFSDLDYVPTKEELAAYIGQKKEADVATAISKYVDPRYATAAEIKAAALKEGYTLTDEEAAKFTGQKDQATQEAAARTYADPLYVLADEAKAYFAAEGYTPTVEELKKYTGVMNEADTAKLIYAYADPLAMTEAEARKYMGDMGYTQPTQAEVAQFVKQAKETDTQKALTTYVDNHQVTQAEVDAFVKQIGYVPAKDELKAYIQQGITTDQTKVMNLLSEYVDPRYVSDDEVRAAYKALGLDSPTEADIKRFIGQYEEATLAGKTKEYLPIATYNLTQQDIANSQKTILDKMAEYEKAGLSRDQALDKAIGEVATNLGKTKKEILDVIGSPAVADDPKTAANEAKAATGIYKTIGDVEAGLKTELGEVKTDLETTIADTQKAILDKVADYEKAGIDRDTALDLAISGVAQDLGKTKKDILDVIGSPAVADDPNTTGNEAKEATGIYKTIGDVESGFENTIADTKKDILNQLAAYEKAGLDRDTALSLAISGVAQDLGTTKSDLLTKIGSTETSLKTELAGVKTELSQDIQEVAELLGKPVQTVTQSDIDYVKSVIGKTDVTPDMLYDVNRDGTIDIKDQTALEQQMRVQEGQNIETKTDPNTGIVTTIDTTTGETINAWDPQTGSKWAPTGIYKVLADQEAARVATAKAQADKAAKDQKKSQFGNLMGLLFSQPDAFQQTTTVKTPDPAKINYIYDFSSIFANPSQAGMMPSPYGPMNTVAPQQMQPQQRQQAANQPLFQLASGFAEGGIVGGNDIEVGDGGSIDDLLNILKGNG